MEFDNCHFECIFNKSNFNEVKVVKNIKDIYLEESTSNNIKYENLVLFCEDTCSGDLENLLKKG